MEILGGEGVETGIRWGEGKVSYNMRTNILRCQANPSWRENRRIS